MGWLTVTFDLYLKCVHAGFHNGERKRDTTILCFEIALT